MFKRIKRFFFKPRVDEMTDDELFNEFQRLCRTMWTIREQFELRREFRKGTEDGTW